VTWKSLVNGCTEKLPFNAFNAFKGVKAESWQEGGEEALGAGRAVRIPGTRLVIIFH